MSITNIAIFSVPVTDQDAAKAFYTDRLGFVVLRDDTFGPQRWLQVAPSGAQTSVTLVTGAGFMPAGSQKGIILASNDIQADYATLKARGVALSELQQAPWGTSATFNDPDGNGWVLQQFAR